MLSIEEKRKRHTEYTRRYRKQCGEALRLIRQAESARYWRNNKKKILAYRRSKPRTEKDREQQRIYTKRYYQKNRKTIAAKAKANRRAIGLKAKERALLKQEKLAGRTKPDRCDICGNRGRIRFDHCHQTGGFRGWICNSCNVVLGYVHDDPSHLEKLIAYITKHGRNASSTPESGPASI